MITASAPIRIESAYNLREHWRVRSNRNTSHRAAAWFALRQAVPKFDPGILPCVVTLTRIAPRELDDDNLSGGFKSVRDGVADWLGLKNDRDARVTWRYAQDRGAAREYGMRIDIERM